VLRVNMKISSHVSQISDVQLSGQSKYKFLTPG